MPRNRLIPRNDGSASRASNLDTALSNFLDITSKVPYKWVRLFFMQGTFFLRTPHAHYYYKQIWSSGTL